MKVKLVNARLSFPALFEAKAGNLGEEPRFSAAFPIIPGSENAKALDAALTAVAKDKWGVKAEAILTELKAMRRVAYKESALSKDGVVYDGYEGMFTVSANSKVRPLVLDRDKSPLVAADGKPYAGCYVDVSIELWAQDNSYGKRINATLSGVQFRADGDAFSGGRPASPEDFDNIADGADAAAMV